MAFDTEIERRAALCPWPKPIVADGDISIRDASVVLGGFPYNTTTIDTELKRRAALLYWGKGITSDGTIDSRDLCVILGTYPFDPLLPPNPNSTVHRADLRITSLVERVFEITKQYRK